MTSAWQAFFDEIARGRDAGQLAEFWWRDDDAARPDPALSRLLSLAGRTATPLSLAVIPMRSTREIFERLGPSVSILQHGSDHANRGAPGEKKTEFAPAESAAEAVARLCAGRSHLETISGGRLLPVLAPPWNRLPEPLAPLLAAAGYRGLSQYGARQRAVAAPGLRQVNTHVDIIAWRSGGGFAGEDAVLTLATSHLAAKRVAAADAGEPTGWLTHHAVHDEAAWNFLDRLIDSTRQLPGVAWCRPEEIFHIR
ncbi:MAG: polysaccharide deacetylase family protein [Candidatus Parcubacteria bacterium]|nr:polysaccharide deacetylase family protein [Burkholderiales bacterium]